MKEMKRVGERRRCRNEMETLRRVWLCNFSLWYVSLIEMLKAKRGYVVDEGKAVEAVGQHAAPGTALLCSIVCWKARRMR